MRLFLYSLLSHKFHCLNSQEFRFNPLCDSSYFTYRQFNIQQLYILPTQCIYVFCVDLRTNSDYFPAQHYLETRRRVFTAQYGLKLFTRKIYLQFIPWLRHGLGG
jgi:hypothetical protein